VQAAGFTGAAPLSTMQGGYGISLPAIAAVLTKTMSNLRAKAKWRFGSMLLTATNNVVATTQMLKM
jgi:hypothetical protein